MKTVPNITPCELELLAILWQIGAPACRSEILERAESVSWKPNSFYILIGSLLENGFVCAAGFARSGKVYGQLYAPTLTLEEYYCNLFSTIGVPDLASLSRQMQERGLLANLPEKRGAAE